MKNITIQVPDWYDEASVEVAITVPMKPKTAEEQMKYLRSISDKRERRFKIEMRREHKTMSDLLPAQGALITIGTLAWHVGMIKTGNCKKHGYERIIRYKWDQFGRRTAPYTDEEMNGFVDELDEVETAATKFYRFFTSVVAVELIGKYGFDNPWEEDK